MTSWSVCGYSGDWSVGFKFSRLFRRNAVVEPSRATRKRLPRTVTRPAMASTCNGSLRSIYHQKKTDRHEFRHAKERPTAARTAFHQAATAQMMNKQQQQQQQKLQQVNKLIETFTTANSPAHHHHHHPFIPDAQEKEDGQHLHHLVLPNQPMSSSTPSYSTNQHFFIYICFLFQIYLNRGVDRSLSIFDCFHRFHDHSKLIILIKCKCLKILFSTVATAI